VILALIVIFLIVFIALPLAGLALWAVISTLIVGLIMGALGRLIVPGTQAIGLLATLLLGLSGAIVGGFIGDHAHIGRILTFLLQIGISAALVAGYSAYQHRRQLQGHSRPELH
jgi:uncharacterized membrane protein YeaQ/YmgE (transglycosylase-associated protein family)